jgi:ABC-type multidrug transport system fused ATPase/permease subunit
MDSTINQATEPITQAFDNSVSTVSDATSALSSSVSDATSSLTSTVSNVADSTGLSNWSQFYAPIVYGLLAVVLAVYGPKLKPTLPNFAKKLLNNNIFRFVILLVIMMISYKDIQLALIVSLAFLLLLSIANCQEVKENYFNYKAEQFEDLQQSLRGFYETEGFEDMKKKDEDEDTKKEEEEIKKSDDKKDSKKKESKKLDDKKVVVEKDTATVHEDKKEENKKSKVGDAVGNLISAIAESSNSEKFDNYEHFQSEPASQIQMEEYENFLQKTIDSYKFNYA